MSSADLIDEFLREEFEREPVHASALGVKGYDHLLGDFSASAFEDRKRSDLDWLARFEGLEAEDEDAIDRDLVLSVLRGRAVTHDWEEWRRSADTYLTPALYGPFVLFLKRTAPDEDLTEAAVARLADVPAVLDAARANLAPDLADQMLVRRSMGMAGAGALYCREFLPGEVSDADLRAQLTDAGQRAASAFDEFAAWLGDFAERCAPGRYPIGADRYSRLLADHEGLPWDAEALRERGRASLSELEADLARRAADLEGNKDFRAVIALVNEDHPSSPDEMRREYEEATATARAFLVEHDLVTFPEGERCEVVPSPPFQRPMLAVASYSQPPAFTASRVGHFFVPYPPEGTPEEDVQRRLAMNSRALIPSIAVHEAYPGHHWHLSVAAGNPRPARKVFGSSYFAEGWGLYTEQMMREQGFFSPREELLQLDMRLFRAARIVVDTSLHIGDMTVEEAVAFMQERAGLTAPVAQAEVARYCAWPTQAASYLTGSLYLEELRERYPGDLKSFHDTLAASGTMPLHLAERSVLGGR